MLTPSQYLVFTTLKLIIRKKKWEKKKLIVTSSFFLCNVFLLRRSRSTIFLLTLPTLKCLQPLLIWTSLTFCRLRKVKMRRTLVSFFFPPFLIMFQPTTSIDRLERICAFCVRDLQFSSVIRVVRSTWHVLIQDMIEY